MLCPYNKEFRVSQPFRLGSHNGLDMVGVEEKSLYSICRGYIGTSTIITDRNNSTWEWGNYIKLVAEGDDIVPDGTLIYYCHLSERIVQKGDRVERGELVGIEGNTGYSFGSHLHLEIRNSANRVTQAVNVISITGLPNIRGNYFPDDKGGELTASEYNELKEMIDSLARQITDLQILVTRQQAVIDRVGVLYESISDVPLWARDTIAAIVADGIIVGDAAGRLNLTPDEVRLLYIMRTQGVL